MRLDTIGVHETVRRAFDPGELCVALADFDAEIRIVTDSAGDDALAACDGLVTLRHREAVFEADLRWLHTIGAGVDHLPLDRLRETGVVVTNSPEVNSDAVAETAVALLLAFARWLPAPIRDGRDRTWSPPSPDRPFLLADATVCLVGLGAVGRRIARRVDALGATVVGVRRSGEPCPPANRVYGPEGLDEALGDARFVVLAVPLTPGTRGLVGAPELAAMREDAYLVNVARGGVVDEDALVEALEADAIGGAGLDTVREEPLPPDSPLWTFEDVVVLPHVGGLYAGYASRLADVVRETAARLRRGTDPPNRVN